MIPTIPNLKYLAFIAGALAGMAAPRAALAGEDAGWQFSTTPFLWASGIDGEIRIGPDTVDVNLGFDDLFDATKYGFQTYFELRRRKFGFYVNPSYLKLSADANSSLGHADFEQDFWLVEAGVFYNLIDTRGARPFSLDGVAGARYWNVDSDLEVHGAMGARPDFGTRFEVVDPVVGVRLRYFLAEKFSLGLLADIGGFGISEGHTSKVSWQVIALAGYDLSDRFTIVGGYRALAIDAEEDGRAFEREIDVVMHGLVLGLQVRW